MSPLISYLLPLRHAGLIRTFAAREVHSRYRQSWLGAVWVVLTPLLMLGVYTLVFRHVFGVRWGTTVESNLSFAIRLYAGLAVFNFFAECVSRAPRLVLDQPHLVKKVVFPLEILPWVGTVAALVHLATALLILMGLGLWELGALPATLVALPLVWLPLIPLTVGLGWWLAGIGTFVRDVGQVIAMVLSLMMFLSPIFFPVEALPVQLRSLIFLNPLALIITETRHVLIDGIWPNWPALGLNFLACAVIAATGAAFFRAARPGFADVV
ncbi:MAG: ABC transporter permease [Burkholderiales bacterium]|nr:ABC transporter permease [Burkholderiales bacterium]